jgi:hypothetical protein
MSKDDPKQALTTVTATELSERKPITQIIHRQLENLLQYVPGLLESTKGENATRLSRLLQAFNSGRFIQQLDKELADLRKSSSIKDDYFVQEQALEGLQILFEFIDEDSPDLVRFEAMKQVFLTMCQEKDNLSDRNDPIPTQLLRICRGLSSGELIVLTTAYKLRTEVKEERKQGKQPIGYWHEEIAQGSGLVFPDLVDFHERKLMDKNLITPRYQNDDLIYYGAKNRLTDLGETLCEFIGELDPRHPNPLAK